MKDAWWWALVALVLFRFFDMVKPLGIKKLDNRQGAFYVMADDLLGGLYAAVSLIIIKIILVSAGII
ncbi:phosphatidylglycerophosphatase A [Segatella copri]|nr:phosphatidylglycerophosphatase A [Segatella copri]